MSNVNYAYITEEDADKIISKSKELMTVWKVGLYHGSIIHFEMGDKETDSKGEEFGTVSLSAEAYDWTIKINGKEEFCSNLVTRELAYQEICKAFQGKKMSKIQVGNEYAVLSFGGDIDIILRIKPHTSKDDDYNLVFTLYLPYKQHITLKSDGRLMMNVA